MCVDMIYIREESVIVEKVKVKMKGEDLQIYENHKPLGEHPNTNPLSLKKACNSISFKPKGADIT